MAGCDKCGCNGKVESKTTEGDEPNNTPPGVGFSFAMCHPPLSQEADGLANVLDSGTGFWEFYYAGEVCEARDC